MSTIDLSIGRWRWRRNYGLATPADMDIPSGNMLPNGTKTNTLLKFSAQPPELNNTAPASLQVTWYKGSVEMGDRYHDASDNDPALGRFWAKVFPATRAGLYSILLFQEGFPMSNPSAETDAPAVRIFSGNCNKPTPVTFYGYGMDNWLPIPGYTFTLTQEQWPQ